MTLEEVIENPELIEVARLAIEDELGSRRDARIGIVGRGNGLVIREKDGTPSDIIRVSVEEALLIGLRAILTRI